MLTFIGIAISDSVAFCINCIVKKCLEGIHCVHFKVIRDFCVCLFTHDRRAMLTTKKSIWEMERKM